MALLESLHTTVTLVEDKLNQLIPEGHALYSVLFQAARYSLLAPSKRIRPLLALAATEALGGELNKAITPACALELIHTYSLIHDDLPCMDDDDLRRGKPTLHHVYPEGFAVLAGDYLLTYAFEILTSCDDLSDRQKVELIATLAQRAGGHGMIAGQILDLSYEDKPVDINILQQIHSHKTAAMIMASVEFGGIIAGASAEELECLQKFGKDIGLAFQVIDDILDITAEAEELGKPIGSDLENNKATYVSLLGLKKSKECAQSLYDSSLHALDQLSGDTSKLASLAEMVITRHA